MIRLDLAELKDPPPAPVRERIEMEAASINSYPDSSYEQLNDAYSSELDIEPDQVVFSNGLDEMIDLITASWPGQVILPVPTFGQFRAAADRYGRAVTTVQMMQGTSYRFEASRLPQTEGITWICSPNNPTGTVIDQAEIATLCDRQDGLVVVDECYQRFSDQTCLDLIDAYENLLVLRSFSKSFGLAGLRLGAAIGQRSVIERLEQRRQPFNVNRLAAAAGTEALQHIDAYQDLWERVIDRGERFCSFLDKQGVMTGHVNGNFVLADLESEQRARRFNDALAQEGISVFPGWDEEFTGLDGRFVRFTIGTEEQMDQVKEAIVSMPFLD